MRFLHKNCLFGPYYTTYRYVASFLYSFLPGLLGQCISETYRQPRSQVLSLASLHSSSNIVGAAHAHYACITKTYRLYSSNDALQVPTLLGVVASVYTPLPTRTQQLPTLLAQQCWELLRPFARSLRDEILKDVSCLNLYKFVTF